MTDNTSNQSWVKFDETDGLSSNNVTRSQPINIDPIRINEDKYTGVHISLNRQHAKILKEPMLLQKQTIVAIIYAQLSSLIKCYYRGRIEGTAM